MAYSPARKNTIIRIEITISKEEFPFTTDFSNNWLIKFGS